MVNPNWADEFVIPYELFPKEISRELSKKIRLNPRIRQKLVNFIVDKMSY